MAKLPRLKLHPSTGSPEKAPKTRSARLMSLRALLSSSGSLMMITFLVLCSGECEKRLLQPSTKYELELKPNQNSAEMISSLMPSSLYNFHFIGKTTFPTLLTSIAQVATIMARIPTMKMMKTLRTLNLVQRMMRRMKKKKRKKKHQVSTVFIFLSCPPRSNCMISLYPFTQRPRKLESKSAFSRI